jgi:hypothetical protein
VSISSPDPSQEISSDDFPSTSDDNIAGNKPFKKSKIKTSQPGGSYGGRNGKNKAAYVTKRM